MVEGYFSFSFGTLARVKNYTFARKIKYLPGNSTPFCKKDGTFAIVKKGTIGKKYSDLVLYLKQII